MDNTPQILHSIKKQLIESEISLKAKLKRSNVVRRLVLPTTEDIYYEEAIRWYKERYDIIDKALTAFNSASFKEKETKEQYKEIIDFLQSYVIENNELNQSLSSILTFKHSSENVRKAAKKQLFQENLRWKKTG